MHAQAWKNDIPDVRSRALAVSASPPSPLTLSPRAAARCASGPVQMVAGIVGVDAMQRACVDLVRCDAAWDTRFGTLPRGADGRVPHAVHLLAVALRGLLPLAGAASLRAAVAFWASEDDAAVLQSLAQ